MSIKSGNGRTKRCWKGLDLICIGVMLPLLHMKLKMNRKLRGYIK
jgi:hypothetical protein